MEPSIDLFLDCHAAIGESPTWVPRERALFWIDVKAPTLNRTEWPAGPTRSWRFGSDIGGFALTRDGNAVVALRQGLALCDLRTGATTLLQPPPFDPALHRFNEGACDAAGRLWLGVMFDPLPGVRSPPLPSALHSFRADEGFRPQPDAAELHNGIAWSPDNRTLYLSHSNGGRVIAFDFDPDAGTLGRKRDLLAIPARDGLPDGAAVDEEGCYWCAVHGGSALRRYAPDGRLLRTVTLPVTQPTMCAFAGDALDEMVVTSAAQKLDAAALRRQPHAGGIFRFRPGMRGVARNPYVA